MKKLLSILLLSISFTANSQKIESIYFNLYTDSLKKGVYNYINIDGKLATGSYLPLMSDEVIFTSTAGKWEGNNIIIDTSSIIDSVVITATLKGSPEIKKSITIYIKKILVDPVLKSEQELLEEWRKKGEKEEFAALVGKLFKYGISFYRASYTVRCL